MIVGLSAWKRSGKDSAAEFLERELGFKRLSFANVLKDMVAEQYGIPREMLEDQTLKEMPLTQYPVDPKDEFSKMIADYMKLEFKKGPNDQLYWTPRALAILEGSAKRSVNSTYWTSRALSKVGPGDRVVVTDLRYKSEAEEIKKRAAELGETSLLIRINRFDSSPSVDSSERDLDDYQGFDFVVENKSTLEEYLGKIAGIVISRL